jgi:hypothetical protein
MVDWFRAAAVTEGKRKDTGRVQRKADVGVRHQQSVFVQAVPRKGSVQVHEARERMRPSSESAVCAEQILLDPNLEGCRGDFSCSPAQAKARIAWLDQTTDQRPWLENDSL